jgi:hypothetical protein
MKKNNDIRPATIEDFNSISKERWAELDAWAVEHERQSEEMNLVPLNKGGEQYIYHRYPIRVLYERSGLQQVAMSNHDISLTETEIQTIGDIVMDNPGLQDALYIAIQEAVESVVDERTQAGAL